MKLRGLNPQKAEMITVINNDVYSYAEKLLSNDGIVVFEEALIRSGVHRKNRDQVQWKALKEDLEVAFGRVLIPLRRTFLREQISPEVNSLHLLIGTRDHLHKGNGNETAGYCFPAKFEDLTKRQINHRRHIAEGNERLADRLERDLDVALPQLPLAANKDAPD